MKRYVFYFVVGLLAFGVGIFVNFVLKSSNLPSTNQNETKEIISPEIENTQPQIFKYGCKELELIPFWEKLDKEQFLNFKKQEIKILKTDKLFTSYPNSSENLMQFKKEWKDFQNDFDCSYFSGIDNDVGLADLNSDGVNELFVIGEFSNYHAEKELFVFQLKSGKYRLILFAIGNQETQLKRTKNSGYLDIESATSESGGSTSIDLFRFNGKNYEERKCVEKKRILEKNREVIELAEPIIIKEKCIRVFSNILRKL